MWMAGSLSHINEIVTRTVYREGAFLPAQPLSMYVFTCAFGCLSLQFLRVNVIGDLAVRPHAKIDHVMIPFWAQMPQNLR
jgi:hypothetical protein